MTRLCRAARAYARSPLFSLTPCFSWVYCSVENKKNRFTGFSGFMSTTVPDSAPGFKTCWTERPKVSSNNCLAARVSAENR